MKVKVDLDDTLCSFCEPWCDWLYINKFTDRLLELKDITSYDFFSKNYGEEARKFFLTDPHFLYGTIIKPFTGAKEFFSSISKKHDVEIVTLATKQDTKDAKIKFVQEHFNTDKIKFIEKLNEKYIYTKDSILIDDYPVHIFNHIKHNKKGGIIFNKNNNGWSKLSNHHDIVDDLIIKSSDLFVSSNYDSLEWLIKNLEIEYGI